MNLNYEFFDKMNKLDAQRFYDEFMAETEETLPQFLADAAHEGLRTNYSRDSVDDMLRWGLARVAVRPLRDGEKALQISPPDRTIEQDAQTLLIIRGLTRYVGDYFTLRWPTLLNWSIGRPNTMLKNQPVIDGFPGQLKAGKRRMLERTPLIATIVSLERVIEGTDSNEQIGSAFDFWAEDLPI
jgi:hypothetical protein